MVEHGTTARSSAYRVLVDHLRSDGERVILLVAVDADEIVGHVLFSGMAARSARLVLGRFR
jgi:predicted N-acetyltransferase YhbS